MSANVWFEEVNKGLLKEIQNTVRYRNTKGVLVPLEDKALIVRKPEEDFKFEVFPCVSIYNMSYRFDPMRYNPTALKVGEDTENKIAILEDHAVPYNLLYYIDFWTKYQEDMDDMTRTWLIKHFRQFNLSVIDDGGVERSCNCVTQNNITKSDLLLNGERLFHSIIKLQIWVELDDGTRYNKPMVVNRNIDIKET